ncbi:hypothetical protein PYCCODRAFT_1429327 [Trametes coccinea BRFM310]|uniref:Uncharacterized protein n=1 Tax=Trametes coccinea (strain BRFM310) TaxID=1353009 RepID=A0A1Y2J4C4_TRAC3|nr:hypothetical protein PYCCODRAFT_1429327 [Trametes coccinea BRFM310]
MDAATNSTTANSTASFDVVRCNAGVPTYPFHATREEWTCSEIYLTTTNATADDKIVLATNFDLSQGRVLVTVPSVMPGDDYVVHLAASPNGINYTDFASDAFNITLRSD